MNGIVVSHYEYVVEYEAKLGEYWKGVECHIEIPVSHRMSPEELREDIQSRHPVELVTIKKVTEFVVIQTNETVFNN